MCTCKLMSLSVACEQEFYPHLKRFEIIDFTIEKLALLRIQSHD